MYTLVQRHPLGFLAWLVSTFRRCADVVCVLLSCYKIVCSLPSRADIAHIVVFVSGSRILAVVSTSRLCAVFVTSGFPVVPLRTAYFLYVSICAPRTSDVLPTSSVMTRGGFLPFFICFIPEQTLALSSCFAVLTPLSRSVGDSDSQTQEAR